MAVGMKGPILLLLFAALVGLGVGWAADDGAAPSATPARAAPSEVMQVSRVSVARAGDWAGDEVRLPRESDGHFYADVEVDGATAHMLVDTGASMIALTGDDAQAIGIVWEADDVQPVAQGANGAVYGVRITLESVRLGEFEARDVEATVVPEGLGISLLGQSFLSRIENVQIQPDAMILGAE